MRRIVFCFVFCFAAAPAWASIAGMVWSQSGEPLSGARVIARRPETTADQRASLLAATPPAPLASATTDERGAFALADNIDGVVVVAVEHDGYAPTWTLTTGDDEDITFVLAGAPQRKGRVTADGKGVAGAIIVAMNGEAPLWSTRTARDGTFAMPEPASWTTALVVVHPDYAPRETSTPNARSSLDIVLTKGEVIAGKVLDARGRPVTNAHVSAGPWSATQTSAEGSFTLSNVLPAVKKLDAHFGTASGSASRGPQSTTISIEERPSISGTVRDTNKRPIPYAVVSAWNKTSFAEEKSAVADDRGRYQIVHCRDGSYMVTASDTSALSFSRATAAAGARGVDVIAVQNEFLTGIVVDEQRRPVAGATVRLSLPQLPRLYGDVRTDQTPETRSGRDGRFKLRAGEELRAYAARSPVRLQGSRRGYALGTSKDLDFKSSVTLTLPAGIELQGVVVDPSGKPVAGAGIVAVQDPYGAVPLPLELALKARMITPFVESNAEGRFTLHLNPAVHDFSAYKQGHGVARVGSYEVASGGGALKLVLQSGVAIRGRVDAPGATTVGGRIVANSGPMPSGYADVADDGTFTVDEIPPGTYTLEYSHQDGRTAQVSAEAPSEGVTIALKAKATIRGRVVDRATQKPLRSYRVSATPQYDVTVVDDEEWFTLELTSGDTSLQVHAEGYQEATQQVVAVPGKTEEVTILVDRGRIIRGRVSDELGTPIGDATLSAKEIGFASSDDDGSYTITLPLAAATLEVHATGYVRKEIELAADANERLDIVLSRGKQARGRVLAHDGTAVAGAEVTAIGAGMPQRSRTGEDGTFIVQGLGDGPHSFHAERDELSSEIVENVDPTAGDIVLRMKPSAGAGAVHGLVKGFTEGGWLVGMVQAGNQHAMIARDGRYRFDKLPAGQLEVRATATGTNDNMSTSRPVRITVVADGDVEADLEFHTETVIRGTVYEDGAPAPFRVVQFSANDAFWIARSNANGEYSVTGPEPGMSCRVTVTGNQRSFETTYQVTGSATFDIRMAWSRIEGRVIDETGAPLPDAQVEVRTSGAHAANEETKSDAAGAFVITMPKDDGAYAVTVAKEGFATVTQRALAGGAPLLVTLARADGLRVRLVDARNGNTLDGYAIAVDDDGHLLARAGDQHSDGTLRLPVATGTYRIAVSAAGHASQLTRSIAPRKDELRVVLTPGGTLIVNTDRASNDMIKLVMPTGEEYVQCQCNGIAEIRLTGTKTVVEHVAPGAYSMQVLDERGLVKASHPITIAEGQTTTIQIHVPE